MTPLRSPLFPFRRLTPRLAGLRMHERFAGGATGNLHFGWLVREEQLVCVKRMHPFHRAPQGAVNVDHPNVVSTFGVLRRPGELLATMEYVPGASLAEIFSVRAEGLDSRIAVRVVADVLHGVHAAHEARQAILPRGLSPSSIVLGEDGHARILDLEVHGPSTTNAVVDKLPYAAPEEVERRDARVDVRRDVWAAGAILWEALTGRSLFRAPTVEATLHALASKAITPPSHVALPEIEPVLDAIALRALARAPEDRFASAREMALELDRASGASSDEVACALVDMDLRGIRERRDLADLVALRERTGLHIECNDRVPKG